MGQLEKTLQEELNRNKEINKYALRLMEQAEPQFPPPAPGGITGAPGTDAGLPPAPDTTAPLAPPDSGSTENLPEPSADDTTEEIDITDLVNMTKNIKQELEKSKTDDSGSIQKMDGNFRIQAGGPRSLEELKVLLVMN